MATVNAGKTGILQGSNSDFATARSTGTTLVSTNPTSDNASPIGYLFNSGRGGGVHLIRRTYVYFDVSSHTGTISNIVLTVKGHSQTNATIRVVPSANAFGGDGSSDIALSEYFTGLDFSNPYNDSAASWSTGINNLALNSDAASDIQNNDAFILALVQADNDFTNTAASSNVSLFSGIAFGTTITLTFDEASSGYSHSVIGVAPANIGKVNALATANIGKINTLD